MTRSFCKKGVGIVIAILFLGCTKIALAGAGSYTTQEIIPGQPGGTSDFMVFLNSLYNFGIGISGMLAVFMTGFGAFKYIVFSAGNASTMSDAKETIYSALFGLGLALIAWLILYVVNPDLVHNTMSTMPTIKDCVDPATCI